MLFRFFAQIGAACALAWNGFAAGTGNAAQAVGMAWNGFAAGTGNAAQAVGNWFRRPFR